MIKGLVELIQKIDLDIKYLNNQKVYIVEALENMKKTDVNYPSVKNTLVGIESEIMAKKQINKELKILTRKY